MVVPFMWLHHSITIAFSSKMGISKTRVLNNFASSIPWTNRKGMATPMDQAMCLNSEENFLLTSAGILTCKSASWSSLECKAIVLKPSGLALAISLFLSLALSYIMVQYALALPHSLSLSLALSRSLSLSLLWPVACSRTQYGST
jgi:hypothetical protein